MNKDDLELLQLAAKAGGVIAKDFGGEPDVYEFWNPLERDGDAFRLSCNLVIDKALPITGPTNDLARLILREVPRCASSAAHYNPLKQERREPKPPPVGLRQPQT